MAITKVCQGNGCTNTPRKGSLFCRPCSTRLGVGSTGTQTSTCLVVTCGDEPLMDNGIYTDYCEDHTNARQAKEMRTKALMYACRVMAEAIAIYAEPTLLGTIVDQWSEVPEDEIPELMMEVEDTMRDFSSFLYLKEDEMYQNL